METIILNISLTLIIVAIVAAAIVYIVKEKKKGVKCIGCSAATCSCGSKTGKTRCGAKEQCDCGCGGASES